MNYCKVCGKKLELTPEYDMCMECQGKQHRTFTLPYIDGVNANHTEMTANDGGEAMEELAMLREYYDEDGEDEATCDSWSIVNNYILKAQAQEQELAELKKSDKSKEQSSIDYYNEMRNYKKELEELQKRTKKIEELLELYRELHETQDMVTYENVLEQIKALEEELK